MINYMNQDCEKKDNQLEARLDDSYCGLRIDAIASGLFKSHLSRSEVSRLIKAGKVYLDGEIVKRPAQKLQHSSEPVELVVVPEKKNTGIIASSEKVPVLFQDENLAVIHKPAGMTVHPGNGTKNDTLVHCLTGQLEKLSDGSEPDRPGIVHRLDRETEGVMVVAKTNQAHSRLAALFAGRLVEKTYYAWVWGLLEKESATLTGFISRNKTDGKKMVFETTDQLSSGSDRNTNKKNASLSYAIQKEKLCFSLLRIQLHTGRTHQIRATFSHISHPVVGDQLYSRSSRLQKKNRLSDKRKAAVETHGMLLVATELAFEHPFTGKKVNFEIDLPARFKKFEQQIMDE